MLDSCVIDQCVSVKVKDLITFNARWIFVVLNRKFVFDGSNGDEEEYDKEGNHDEYDDATSESSFHISNMDVFPVEICWLLCMPNLDLGVHEVEIALFQQIVMCFLILECYIE